MLNNPYEFFQLLNDLQSSWSAYFACTPCMECRLHGSIPVLHQQNVTSGQTVENNQNANHEHIQDMSLFVLP